jgi:hypothetical protein
MLKLLFSFVLSASAGTAHIDFIDRHGERFIIVETTAKTCIFRIDKKTFDGGEDKIVEYVKDRVIRCVKDSDNGKSDDGK